MPSAAAGNISSASWARQGEGTIGPKTVGIALPYSAEYLGLDVNRHLLARLAERTGGQVLQADTPDDAAGILFSTAQGTGLPSAAGRPLNDFWPWFVLAALCVFVAENRGAPDQPARCLDGPLAERPGSPTGRIRLFV